MSEPLSVRRVLGVGPFAEIGEPTVEPDADSDMAGVDGLDRPAALKSVDANPALAGRHVRFGTPAFRVIQGPWSPCRVEGAGQPGGGW
ncbi:hypothetical protein P3T29_006548 [Kitasatospora sp. MAP5-34]|nr:hypothetical protein [Kitasatospora sp. MAP5-34]